jgi:energy-coupling factor transporter ATP-binding protein EcfA2
MPTQHMTPYGDMNDLDQVQKLIGALLYSNAKERTAQGLPASGNECIKLAGDAICANIECRGTLYNCDGVGYILLRGQEAKPIRISPTDARFADLLIKYGIGTGMEAEKRIGKFLGIRAIQDGHKTSIRHFFYYNPETETAYICEQLGQLLRVTKDGIERVPNGTDGQLFEFNEKYQEYKVDLGNLSFFTGGISRALVPSDMLAKVFHGIQFEPSRLTVEQKMILISTWIVVMMLSGLIVEKPILQIVGPSGSGKTTMLEIIGRTLFGPEFRVERLAEDAKEFENAVINNDFLAIDNTTGVPKGIRSLICQTVTGFRVTRRELYTTMGQVQRTSTATLSVAGITKMLNETETSNRSIDVHITERPSENNISEQDLHNEIDWERAELMGELLVRVQMVLKALDAERDYTPRTSLRLAGFASVLLRVARHEGWEAEAKTLIDAWHEEQIEAALEGEDVAQALSIWMSQPGWKPTTMTAEQLNHELVNIAHSYSMGETSWSGKAQYLGMRLQRSLSSYRRRFGLEIVRDSHTKSNRYRFAPTEEQLSLLRDTESAPTAIESEPEPEKQEEMF